MAVPEGALRPLRRDVDRGQASEECRQLLGYIDECRTGRRGRRPTTKSKLGTIAAKPIPQVLRNISAFTLGAQA
jgi:simple sugar transport system substrate-binding protein